MPTKKYNKRYVMKLKYKRFASKVREDLLRQLKVVSAMQDKQIQQILEDAIVQYLEKYKYQESISEHGEVQEIQVRYSMEPREPDNDEKER